MALRNILIAGMILTLVACQSSTHDVEAILVSPDTSRRAIQLRDTSTYRDIYDFIKVVIDEQQLDLTYGLDLEPVRDGDLSSVAITGIDSNDVQEMMLQEKKLKNFVWVNSKLGFNLVNRKNWYRMSVPLFSKDRKKVVMSIESLCPGLCGTGGTVVFKYENNKWNSNSFQQYLY